MPSQDAINAQIRSNVVTAGRNGGRSHLHSLVQARGRIRAMGTAQGEGPFIRFKTYAICTFSDLGPKLQEGDRRAPEGFLAWGASQLNPFSRHHRSFNLGFPNAYDRAHGRTGSYLMIHGSCSSIGCYAMTIPASLRFMPWPPPPSTQPNQPAHRDQARFHVHAFPFIPTDAYMGVQHQISSMAHLLGQPP